MIDQIIQYEQLKTIFGGSSAAEVAARLKTQSIPYRLGKRNLPITTFSALNHAMGIPLFDKFHSSQPEKDQIEI